MLTRGKSFNGCQLNPIPQRSDLIDCIGNLQARTATLHQQVFPSIASLNECAASYPSIPDENRAHAKSGIGLKPETFQPDNGICLVDLKNIAVAVSSRARPCSSACSRACEFTSMEEDTGTAIHHHVAGHHRVLDRLWIAEKVLQFVAQHQLQPGQRCEQPTKQAGAGNSQTSHQKTQLAIRSEWFEVATQVLQQTFFAGQKLRNRLQLSFERFVESTVLVEHSLTRQRQTFNVPLQLRHRSLWQQRRSNRARSAALPGSNSNPDCSCVTFSSIPPSRGASTGRPCRKAS